MFTNGEDVLILTGKYSGLVGFIDYQVSKHHLSNHRRWLVRVQSGWGWVCLKMNEHNLKGM